MIGEVKKSLLIINATVVYEQGLEILDNNFELLFLFNLIEASTYLQSNKNIEAIVIDTRTNPSMYCGFAEEIHKLKAHRTVPIFLVINPDFDLDSVEHFSNLHFVYNKTLLSTLEEVVGFEKVKKDSEDSLSQNGGFVLLRHNLNGDFLSAKISDRTRNLLDYSKEEIESFVSDNLFNLVYEEDRELATNDVNLIIASNSVMTDSFRVKGKNKIIWLRISAKRFIQDSIIYLFLQLNDVTKQVTSEMRSSIIIDSVPNGIVLLFKRSDKYYINFLNQTSYLKRFFGEDEFKHLSVLETRSFIHKDDVDAYEACLDHILRTKEKSFIEYRSYDKDGVLHYYNLVGNYILADNGEPAVCAIISDITERKIVEAKLRFEGIVIDSMPGGVTVIVKNEDVFNVAYANDAYLAMRGFDETDANLLFDSDCFHFVAESDKPKLFACFDEILKTKKKQIVIYRAITKDGEEKVYSLTGNYFTWNVNQPAVCSVNVDITDLVEAEEKNKTTSALIDLLMQDQLIVLFDYDCKTDTLRIENRRNETIIENYLKEYLIGEHTYLSRETARKLISTINEIDNYSDEIFFDFKAPIFTDEKTWCRAKALKITDENSRVVRLVGRIADVREEHVLRDNVQSLEKRVVVDSLTGLYNYQESKKLIIEAISKLPKNDFAALLILDIDDFKNFNDHFGHQVGNAVLLELSQVLKKSFRSYDIIGRFGGDEFIIYINSIAEKEILVTRIEHILAAIKDIDLQINTSINCSIGACLIDNPSIEFEKIFALADIALYEAKDSGKGTYRIKLNEF